MSAVNYNMAAIYFQFGQTSHRHPVLNLKQRQHKQIGFKQKNQTRRPRLVCLTTGTESFKAPCQDQYVDHHLYHPPSYLPTYFSHRTTYLPPTYQPT